MILRVRNLTTKLRIDKRVHTVIDGLSFDLEKGKTLALVGESGCGKSLTALSLLRILPTPPALPPEGEVLFHGENLLTLPESRMRQIRGQKIAMIFQNPTAALNPVYPIGYQMLEVATTHLKLKPKEAKAFIFEALRDVHLPATDEQLQAYPHQLSGGMLQRVMIAMSLICSPEILIADEPTTALDVTIQAQILDLLKELQEKRGMATLMITHDMGVVSEIADEVIVMYTGEQIEKSGLKTLFENPAHPYTQALFAARPDAALHQRKLPALEGNVPKVTDLPKGCRFAPRCRYAMEICEHQKPDEFNLPETGHVAKCWLYDEELKWKIDDEEAFRS